MTINLSFFDEALFDSSFKLLVRHFGLFQGPWATFVDHAQGRYGFQAALEAAADADDRSAVD